MTRFCLFEFEWIFGLCKLKPVSALAALRFALVQPHVVNVEGVLVTHAPNESLRMEGGDQSGLVLRPCGSLQYLHHERVLQIKEMVAW